MDRPRVIVYAEAFCDGRIAVVPAVALFLGDDYGRLLRKTAREWRSKRDAGSATSGMNWEGDDGKK